VSNQDDFLQQYVDNDPAVAKCSKQLGEQLFATYQSLEREAVDNRTASPPQFHYAAYMVLLKLGAVAALSFRNLMKAQLGDQFDVTRDHFLTAAGRAWDALESKFEQSH
jgi:hypothetical protein